MGKAPGNGHVLSDELKAEGGMGGGAVKKKGARIEAISSWIAQPANLTGGCGNSRRYSAKRAGYMHATPRVLGTNDGVPARQLRQLDRR